MANFYISLSDDEFVGLSQDAFRNCRHPREQARHFIREGLKVNYSNGGEIVDYKIVTGEWNDIGGTKQFESEVKQAFVDGWEPLGNVSISYADGWTYLAQAMIKYAQN